MGVMSKICTYKEVRQRTNAAAAEGVKEGGADAEVTKEGSR